MNKDDHSTLQDDKNRFHTVIAEMKQAIITSLETLNKGYGRSKHGISRDTGIPYDILTPLLKQLKYQGMIELIMFWCEATGMPNGSGYCLVGNSSY